MAKVEEEEEEEEDDEDLNELLNDNLQFAFDEEGNQIQIKKKEDEEY